MTTVLIDLAVKSGVLLAVAAMVVLGLRWSSAAARHLLWTAAFAAVVALPIARGFVPSLGLPVFRAAAPSTMAPLPDPERAVPVAVVRFEPVGPPADAGGSNAGPESIPSSPARRADRRTVGDALVAVWLAGAAILLLRIAMGSMAVHRLARRWPRVADEGLSRSLDEMRGQFGVRRRITLFSGADDLAPMTWGVVRPAVLLPSRACASGGEASGRLAAVLAHEVVHIARLDAVSNALARVAVALFWFNPMFWLAARHARLERERACDDAVLRRGARASDYASHLLAFAGGSGSTLGMARSTQLERRIGWILDATVNRRPPSGAHRLVATTVALLTLPIAATRLTARTPPPEARPTATNIVLAAPRPPRVSGRSATADIVHVDVLTPRSVGALPVLAQTSAVVLAAFQQPARQPTPEQSVIAALAQLDEQAWRATREEMIRQLLAKAEQHLDAVRAAVRIGIDAAYEIAEPAKIVANCQVMLVEQRTAPPNGLVPPDVERAAMRRRFVELLSRVDLEETRFSVGLSDVQNVDALLTAAATLLREPIPSSAASAVVGPTPSDADLLAALKDASSITSDTDRADRLLALSRAYAFTTDMVALYVAAANGISSPAERARVFGQPIRVK